MTHLPSRTLHLGITPWHLSSTMDAHSLCSQAELAEQCGYQSFWLPESHFGGPSSVPEPMLLLSAVAARTTTIKLGTSSYLLPIRRPLQAAEQVAVLDQLSGGRLILGLGRGFQAAMLDAYTVNPKDKRDLLERTLTTMKQAWAGGVVGSTEHGAVISPRPVQQPHPPIWMAAFGPKALQQAGKMGAPYLASPMESLAQLEQNYQVYHAALSQHGHSKPAEVAIMRTVFINDNNKICQQISRELKRLASTAIPGKPAFGKSWIIGNAEDVYEQIREYRERLGMNTLIVARPRLKGLKPQWCENTARQLPELLQD